MIPPNTPICRVLIPKTFVTEPSSIPTACSTAPTMPAMPLPAASSTTGTVISLPDSTKSAWIAVCMMKNAITLANAATSFSCLAIPTATPMANNKGRLSKITLPQLFKIDRNPFNNVPSPKIASR